MTSKLFLLSVVFLTLAACASTHPGSMAAPDSERDGKIPVVISAEAIEPEVEEAFQLIELTIENQSNDWVRLNKGQVLIDNPHERKISTVVGNDLKDWARAKELQLKKDEHNAKLLQGALMLAGTAASHSENKMMASTGLVLATGGLIWAVSDTIKGDLRTAEKADQVPESHLGNSVSIPAKMFQRRWVLLNKPPGQLLQTLAIELETISGEKAHYVIKI